MSACQPIDSILRLVEADRNSILSTSKSEMMEKVIWMANSLSSNRRNKIQLEIDGLVYDKTKSKPHDPSTEFFICNECKIVIVFPVKTEK